MENLKDAWTRCKSKRSWHLVKSGSENGKIPTCNFFDQLQSSFQSTSFQYVWECVDQTLPLKDNKLKIKTGIEGLYFLKLFKAVYSNEANTLYEKKRKHNQASTLGHKYTPPNREVGSLTYLPLTFLPST